MKGSTVNTRIKFISFTASVLGIVSFCLTSIPLIISILNKAAMPISIILGAVFVVLFMCIAIFRQRIAENMLKFFMNLTSLDKPYKLLHKTVIYEFLSREQMRHEKTFLVKALHSGVDHITDKFQWSGGEVYALQAKTANKESLNEIVFLKNRSGIQTYGIYDKSGKRYGRGEVFEMGMKMELKDPERKSSPYLSSGVYEKTERLTLVVLFSLDLRPVNIRKLSYIHYTDEDHYKCEDGVKLEINAEGNRKMVVFDIPSPIYGGKYIIEWEFEE
jgi:hypothetical protein